MTQLLIYNGFVWLAILIRFNWFLWGKIVKSYNFTIQLPIFTTLTRPEMLLLEDDLVNVLTEWLSQPNLTTQIYSTKTSYFSQELCA